VAKREKKLTQAQCEAVLNEHLIGTLSLTDGKRPYAIQLEYLFHDGALYMGTYLTGRKIDYMKQNDRAVFTVFDDRHGHPEMIKKNVPCRSVMVEGRIGTLHQKEFTNRKGETKTYRLLRFEIEEMGSWQCSRPVCTLVAGLDPKKILLDWVQEAKQAGTPA
jgi:nitroimidazol reductase NimA-like FMN-containing flavoprotein (pyridoxamine 5'-phosphate oxidase superfamily)